MKTIATIILSVAAFLLICGEVTDEANFVVTFLWVKALGFACAYAAYRIGRTDRRLRRLAERFSRMADER